MHVRKTARDALFPTREDDAFFAPRRGDLVFRDLGEGAGTRRGFPSERARIFADRINRGEGRSHHNMLSAAELRAMALVHQIFHAVVDVYRRRHPDSFDRLARSLEASLGDDARAVIIDFVAKFPPPKVYRTLKGEGDDLPLVYLRRAGAGIDQEIDEELILLWVINQNPAYQRVRTIVGDQDIAESPRYRAFVSATRQFFANEPPIGPGGETLVDLLLLPGKRGGSIFDQLGHIDESWAHELGLDELPLWDEVTGVKDLKAEEDKYFEQKGPGPGEPLLESMRFGRRDDEGPAQFSPDLNWMPNVVLIAKSVYVWLDQLGRKYNRYINRLDQIPDEELDLLASRHINGLWLIGLFERSRASRRVKQMRGDHEALASAYSLKEYNIANDLGGYAAYENLRNRAWSRGIRLAADMVPNHVGIDGDWVFQHPDWFLQAERPPFPVYRFGGPDLSDNERVGVFLEEGYWNKTDAAVVFRRHDRWTGEDRFIYHGNDGTSMPWNDTAQLDYTKAEVRHAVIETILHVARMFPIIRFDAAMTLAKRHIQRLWFPLPGHADQAIPSRGDYAMTQEQFDAAIPVEFWREVVDTVAERAPDTLLLAEAFWMMEGYFVRTLGMHRVYNSAFMNMMKREENAKYKETIKNVLDFDPEILKRFVNFMNNPDEETAIAQFGADDRYFGVCAVMCTMPGLPMFGHGQIEGLQEKYGMEYRRARYDEHPNEYMIRRHEREIFPILEKRWLFSGVEHFAMYDFVTDSGMIDDDVYAYSNGAGHERALVLFNNRYKVTRGRIQASTHKGTLGRELALDEDRGAWLIIRDVPNHLEYLRLSRDIIDGGMAWQLDAFKYHVLTGFRPVSATLERPYHRLAAELNGRGVPDVERAVRELYLRPIHAPLREAVSKGHLGYLGSQLDTDSDVAARAALEERLGHVADGLDWMLTQRAQRDVTIDRATGLNLAGDRFAALHKFVREDAKRAAAALEAMAEAPVPEDKDKDKTEKKLLEVDEEPPAAPVTASVLHIDLLLAWIQVEAVMDLLASGDAALEEARSRPPAYWSTAAGRAEQAALAKGDPISERELAKLHAPDPSAPRATETTPDLSMGLPNDTSRDLPNAPSTIDVGEKSAALVDEEFPDAEADTEVSSPVLPPDLATTASPSPSPPPPPPPPSARTVTAILEATWASREALLAEWELATPVVQGFVTSLGEHQHDEAKRRAALVVLAATLPSGPLGPALRLALGTERGQQYMNVHADGGVWWLNKERYEELVRFLAEREIASGRVAPETARADADGFIEMALNEGYRAERIAARLGPTPNVDTPLARAQHSSTAVLGSAAASSPSSSSSPPSSSSVVPVQSIPSSPELPDSRP